MRRNIKAIILIVSICISLGTVYGLQGGPTNSTVNNYENSAPSASSWSSIEIKPGWPEDPRLLVQPNDGMVQQLARQLNSLQDIARWVYENVTYVSDNSTGFADMWQPACYTVITKEGDCEDKGVLLCSLLRAKGVSAEDVRVVVGTFVVNGEILGHSWVQLRSGGEWAAFGEAPLWPPTALICWFNDVYFENYVPWPPT